MFSIYYLLYSVSYNVVSLFFFEFSLNNFIDNFLLETKKFIQELTWKKVGKILFSFFVINYEAVLESRKKSRKKIRMYMPILLNWDLYQSFRLNFLLSKFSVLIKVVLFTLLFICLVNLSYKIYRGFFVKIFFIGLSWFFLGYWLLSTFWFLFKKSRYTVFTRIIQRFWKRTLSLFWLLEVSLFSIYLFLTLISPQEYLFVDAINFYHSYVYSLKSFFKNIMLVIVLILLWNLVILLHKHNVFNVLLKLLIFVIMLVIFWEDYVNFFFINQYYTNTIVKFDPFWDKKIPLEIYTWNAEHENLKRRTLLHFFFLLSFLKFWHTCFIFLFFLFFELNWLKSGETSYNILSATQQNLFLLLFFSFILKIVFFKYYMNYLYEFVYYWFVLNNHFFDMNYYFILFDKQYLFFFYECLI